MLWQHNTCHVWALLWQSCLIKRCHLNIPGVPYLYLYWCKLNFVHQYRNYIILQKRRFTVNSTVCYLTLTNQIQKLIKCTTKKYTLICLPLNSDSSSAIANSTLSFSANSIYANLQNQKHKDFIGMQITAWSEFTTILMQKCIKIWKVIMLLIHLIFYLFV